MTTLRDIAYFHWSRRLVLVWDLWRQWLRFARLFYHQSIDPFGLGNSRCHRLPIPCISGIIHTGMLMNLKPPEETFRFMKTKAKGLSHCRAWWTNPIFSLSLYLVLYGSTCRFWSDGIQSANVWNWRCVEIESDLKWRANDAFQSVANNRRHILQTNSSPKDERCCWNALPVWWNR